MDEARIDTSDDIGLSKLMKTVRELFVRPEMKVMIHKIVNRALYVGMIANTYQREIKKVKSPEVLVSPVCIYRTYEFSNNFTPKYHKLYFTPEQATTTYEWVLWDNQLAQHIWAECKRIRAQIGIVTTTFNSYQEAIRSLEDPNTNDDDELNQLRTVIKQHLVVYALWVL